MNRAASIRIRPTATMPINDQIWARGAAISDLTGPSRAIPLAATGSTPRIRASQMPLNTGAGSKRSWLPRSGCRRRFRWP